MTSLFSPGCLYVTCGINALILQGVDLASYLDRHLRGDWGDIDPDDKAANDHAVSTGNMILSAYHVTPEIKIWVITQGGTTTIMLPDEY